MIFEIVVSLSSQVSVFVANFSVRKESGAIGMVVKNGSPGESHAIDMKFIYKIFEISFMHFFNHLPILIFTKYNNNQILKISSKNGFRKNVPELATISIFHFV